MDPEDNSSKHHRINSLDRALEIPSVNYLWYKSAEVYSRFKCVNPVINRAFDKFENAVSVVATLIEKPIFTLDRSLCQGIDFVQVKLEEPIYLFEKMIDRTRMVLRESLKPAVNTLRGLKYGTEEYVSVMKIRTTYRVHYLRLYSWQQADRVMSTETGATILKTVDSTTEMARLLLDKYLPAPEEEDCCKLDDECSEHDNLHHTMLRLSEFSRKASRRIYLAIMESLQHMYKIEIIVLILHALIVIMVVKVIEILLTFFLKSLN